MLPTAFGLRISGDAAGWFEGFVRKGPSTQMGYKHLEGASPYGPSIMYDQIIHLPQNLYMITEAPIFQPPTLNIYYPSTFVQGPRSRDLLYIQSLLWDGR